MKDFLKYFETHLQNNPAIPGQRDKKEGEEDYLDSAIKKKKKELDIDDKDTSIIDLMNLMNLLKKSEIFIKGHEKELETLALDSIKNMYRGLIERYKMEFDIKLSGYQDIAKLLGIQENIQEIYKRKIINLVSQGEALNTKHILHSQEIKDGIKKIYGEKATEIFTIWDKITKEAAKLDQNDNLNNNSRMPNANLAGAVDIKWIKKENINESVDDDDFDLSLDDEGISGNDNEKIEKNKENIFSFLNTGNIKGLDNFLDENDIDPDLISKNFKPIITVIGRDFPMLLHESVKGVYNVLAIGGIPEDKDVARIALKKGYARSDEPEDWKYGPSIAGDIRDFINENELVDSYPNVREQVWKYMVDRKKMTPTEFLELIRGILSKTQEARIKVDAIIKIVVNSIKKFYDKKEAKEKYEREMSEYKIKKEKYDKELEEWNRNNKSEIQSKPNIKSYADKTPNELQIELNNALETGDYTSAVEISKYIK